MIKLKPLLTKQRLVEGFNRLVIDLNEYIGHIETNSPIHYYVKKYKKLDPEEELELIKKYQDKKDSKAFDRLIRGYSKYMISMIMKNKNKFANLDPNITTEEVFNTMIMNFARAINKFDADKGAKFFTYLDKWLYEVVRNYKHYITKSSLKIRNKSGSIDKAKNTEDGKLTMADLLADPDAVDNYKAKEKRDFMSNLAKKGFKKLTDDEQFVIRAKYGFLNAEEEDKILSKKGKVTNKTIAAHLNITAPGVRVIHVRSLLKLRKAMK